ncbi:MAG: glycerophosphodiester phosphodiesterase family protein [Eubacterium sp.]|nr:glycerophosphodiester phosphodiesterase family protein [Eubacterium sp.]
MDVMKIAHRGLSAWAPENTEVSFRLATECNCFGIECDIWRTLDGTYVVSHDNSMKRMYGIKRLILDSTYEDIKDIPVTGGNAVADSPTQHMCTLQRYLHVVAESDKVAFIELKQEFENRELQEILELVNAYDMYERTFFISSLAPSVLRLRHDLCFPRERLQYVHGARPRDSYVPVNDALVDRLIHHGIGLDSRHSLLEERHVDHLHDEGLLVNVWTVNTEENYRHVVDELGVDMVTMNDVKNSFDA